MPGIGWSAQGLLEPLWKEIGGRDELARRTGILGQTLSGYNTGKRPLGLINGRKIASALGVSLAELGGPLEGDDPRSQMVGSRLERLEEQALTVVDLQPILRVLQLLATGRRSEALRVLSEELEVAR